MGFHVFKAVALMPEARVRCDLGETIYHLTPSDEPKNVEQLAIGICTGYLAEMIYYFKIKRFYSEGAIEFCNRADGYEVAYAAFIYDHTPEDDLFETVIFKTKRYLQTPFMTWLTCTK